MVLLRAEETLEIENLSNCNGNEIENSEMKNEDMYLTAVW